MKRKDLIKKIFGYASKQKATAKAEEKKKMEKDLKFEELKESITFEELNEMLRDCIGYDGSFEDLDYWENDEEFFDCMFNDKMELVRAISYGNYNYMDTYVTINAYGNVESCCEYEYQQNVESQKEEIIEHYLELYSDDNVCPSESLKQKLYTYYEEDEENDEEESEAK